MFSSRLVWALLLASAVVVTGVLLLDAREPAPRMPVGGHTESPADQGRVSPIAGEHSSELLREIRDSQNGILEALRAIGDALSHGLDSDPATPSPHAAADDEDRWVARVREAERRVVAEEVVRVRANLLTEARMLAASSKSLKPDDPQLHVKEQQLRDIDEALQQLPSVRTVDDLVRFKFDFSSVLRS